jgi:hypothetical protein
MNKALNFEVYNNTLVNIAPTVAVGFIESRFAGSHGIVRNNLADKVFKPRDGGTIEQNNNYVTATGAMFVNASQGNFCLKSTAIDAIDQGYNLAGIVDRDFDGALRRMGCLRSRSF